MAVIAIPITKGKGTVDIDTDKLADDVFREAMLQGLKVLSNRAMSKITKETYPVEAELQAAAMAKARENVEAILAGKIKFTGVAKSAKVSGAVMTEARRLARNIIKDEMKKAGIKVSHVAAKDITAAANELLGQDPTIVEQAKANLEQRAATPPKIDIKSLVKESPELVAKAEARKAKAKADAPLSAKQAGRTAVRAKAKQPAATA